ncbi:MAG: hypothetical protein HYV13_02845 [Candidatus Doudnabacteria bacterium]|nr:hypothetical protein [Candidatus Doudnabacteria bacterium]
MATERQIGDASDRVEKQSAAQALLQKIAAAEASGNTAERDRLLEQYKQYEDLDIAA